MQNSLNQDFPNTKFYQKMRMYKSQQSLNDNQRVFQDVSIKQIHQLPSISDATNNQFQSEKSILKIDKRTNLLAVLRSHQKQDQIPLNNYEEYIHMNLLERLNSNKQISTKISVPLQRNQSPINNNYSVSYQSGFSRTAKMLQHSSSANFRQNNSNDSSVLQSSKLQKSVDNEGQTKLNEYTIISTLGQGAFGKVKLARGNEKEFVRISQFLFLKAIKIANKKKLKRKLLSLKLNAYSLLEREIAIMKKVSFISTIFIKISHPNIVQLFEVIDDPNEDKLYMVMEYMERGSIQSKCFLQSSNEMMILDELKDDFGNRQLPTEQCRYYFRQFALGLDYLHNCAGVIHRDIKPDNLLVSHDNQLKIADFGVSRIIEGETISCQAGTLAFLAPEVLSNGKLCGKPVDIWAGGVTLYQLNCGSLPFPSHDAQILKEQIRNDEADYSEISDVQLKDLLQSMLEKDPDKRITIVDVLQHPWVTNNGTEPLHNEPIEVFEVTEEDMSRAIKKLSVGVALKTACKMISLAKKSKFQIRKMKQ